MAEPGRALVPVDLRLPQTPEECFPFRIALGQALNQLMALKAAADGVIAEYMGDRSEAAVGGVVYEYSGQKSWEYPDEVALLQLLTECEADGSITPEDFAEAVTITPQPDLVKFNAAKIRRLVEKRGLTAIDGLRVHREGPRKLRVKE